MSALLRPASLWLLAVALVTVGTALVFAAVTLRGWFAPGVVLIDAGLLAAAAAAVLQLRTGSGSAAEEQGHPG